MLVHIKELFNNDPTGKDVVGKFAYPAFNTMNLETTIGIIAAAEEMNSPIILETSEGAIKYAGLETLYEIIASLAVHAKVPVALHMDHGKDMEQLKAGIELGYSSVMIDHSGLSYDENVRDTKAMVEFAKAEGAWVQGEIGKIRGSEDWVSVSESEALLTDPEEAKKFFEATGVNTLAASFGTIHGVLKMSGKVTAHVDVERIKKVHSLVNVPLVLHGASGVPDNVITEAIAAGIAIINIDTELRMGFTKELRIFLASHPDEIDPRKFLNPAIEGVKQAALKKLKAFKTRNILTKV
jgi:fructose-bisphosphate aldolase, class II